MKTIVLIATLAAVVSGCAKSPESIAPAYVSERTFRDYSCDELQDERERVRSALSSASQQQSDARTNDVVGVLLLGLPVSTLSGGNVAYQVADLKGQMEAIDKSMIQRRCNAGGGRRTERTAQRPVAVEPQVVPRRAPLAEGMRPMPTGANVAAPVSYSAEEIVAYCRAGWDSRELSNGKTEYNPCYYQ